MTATDTPGVPQPPALRREPPRVQITRALRRRRRVRAGIVQLLYGIAALALGLLVPDISIGFELPSGRTTEILVAIGAGTVTFIGVVFSLLFLVTQHGSTTFTPRLNLFRDAPIVWHAFALYTAVVIYSFTAAFKLGNTTTTSGLVPIVAVVLVLIAIALYRALQLGAFNSIQLASTLAQVEARGRTVIDGLYPVSGAALTSKDSSGQRREPVVAEVQWPKRAAILQVIDVPRVLEAAEHAGACVEFTVGPGDMLLEESSVAEVRGVITDALRREVVRSLTVGQERTFEQDPALALRVLADIALRSLSPAVNDPTSAVQTLDWMDALLRVLVKRDLDISEVRSADGVPRVVLVLPSWDDFLATALDELLALPHLPITVGNRIEKLLRGLIASAPEAQRPPLEARLRMLTADDSAPTASPLPDAAAPPG